jgi:hypothetical protein
MIPIGMGDLPEEILHEIAAYLLHPDQYTIPQDPLLWPGMQRAVDRYAVCKTPQGRDVMALSSTCKWMRQALLGRWLLENVRVKVCEKDLSILEGLTEETRDCVR